MKLFDNGSDKNHLLSIKWAEEPKIREVIKQRKIEILIHFTRIDNLHSILQNGLVPVSMQQKMKIQSVRNDKRRIDAKLKCTSCSVEFPNYKLFSKFRKEFPGTRWAVLVLKKDLLFSPSNIAYYYHTNAAVNLFRDLRKDELCTANAFESMFCDPIMTKDNDLKQRASHLIRDNNTTDPQAEILISDIIDTQYILDICFEKTEDRDNYIQKNESAVLNNYKHLVLPYFFGPRNDYIFWQ